MNNSNNYILKNFPMSIGDLLSNSWRLCRLNLLTIYFFLFIPVLLLILILTIINRESSPVIGIFLDPSLNIIVSLIGIIFFLTLINFGFTKLCFNLITKRETSKKFLNNYVKSNFSKALKLSIIITIEISLFIALDILLYFLLITAIMFIEPFIQNLFKNNSIQEILFLFLLLISLFFILLFFFIVSVQLAFCYFQLITVSSEELPIRYGIVKSWDIISSNIQKFCFFILSIFTLCYILFLNFYSIFLTILMFSTYFIQELFKIPKENYFLYSFSDIISLTVSIYLIWPLIIASLVMYFCDYKAQYEGFDLLEAIIEEKKRSK